MSKRKLIRATVPMCRNCGSARIETDARSFGDIYECNNCGHEDNRCHYGYYAPDVAGVVAEMHKYYSEMPLVDLDMLDSERWVKLIGRWADTLEGKSDE